MEVFAVNQNKTMVNGLNGGQYYLPKVISWLMRRCFWHSRKSTAYCQQLPWPKSWENYSMIGKLMWKTNDYNYNARQLLADLPKNMIYEIFNWFRHRQAVNPVRLLLRNTYYFASFPWFVSVFQHPYKTTCLSTPENRGWRYLRDNSRPPPHAACNTNDNKGFDVFDEKKSQK